MAAGMIVGATSACVIQDELPAVPDLFEPLGLPSLRVREITIDSETDDGRLEMEVHLLDDATGELLGCAGALQGLLSVDEAGVAYKVDAHFARPGESPYLPTGRISWMTAGSVQGRTLRIRVVEDDQSACPTQLHPFDDILGEIGGVRGDDLQSLQRFSLPEVPNLVLGAVSAEEADAEL